MKKILKYLFIITIVLIPVNISAASYTINTKASTAKSCTIKTQPNEGGSFLVPGKIHYLDPGDIVTLVDDTKTKSTNSKCSSYYYHVSYSGNTGYVCGDYINFDTDGKYYQELRNAGFPESYLSSLNALKEKHPNWVFTALKTNIDFNTAVSKESVVGKSYIQVTDPNGEDSVLLSLDGLSYDASTKTFIQKEAGGWYAANANTIAYYMDPRNFLNERDIYMFENSSYNDKNQTSSAVSNIFSGNSALLGYTNNFMDAATYNGINISPTMLAARSRLEVATGSGLSNAANGSKGYYNFYNIGAFSNCVNPIICGNTYANSKGWTTADSAIKGGAAFIYTRYLQNGQNSLYLQKYNVTGSSTYANQYMTNIMAPKSEANYLYKGYSGANTLNTTTYFVIPVYNNMSDTVSALPTTMNQEELNKANNSSTSNKNTLSVDAIVNGSGYRYNDSYISNVGIGTDASTMINKLKSMSSDASITITSDGRQLSGSEKLGSGDIVKISNNGNEQSLRVVIYGDANGDGDINVLDLLKVQKHILNTASLSGSHKEAADVNKDGNINVLDLLKVQKQILGTANIEQ